jgi:hypothetical protein
MSNGIVFQRLTQFAWGRDNTSPEVWVNVAQVAYVAPRIVMRGGSEAQDGTLIYFQQEAGVLAVRESVGHVVALLTSRGGVCRDCYQPLSESWMSLCDDCREHRHNGVDHDPEQAPTCEVLA